MGRTGRLALLVGVLAMTAVEPVAAQPAGAPLYAAHRGGSLLWAENGLTAFRNATALGADCLEFDVHLTRDGETVVIHDPTLDRTTTGSGPVRERTLGELRTLKLKDKDGRAAADTVPTLAEVLEVAARGQRQLLLEIKVDDRGQRYPGIEEKVLAALDRHGLASRAVVMAFGPDTWQRVRELRPDVRAGALYSGRMIERMGTTLAAVLDDARKAGVAFVGLHQGLVTADTVALARRAGVVLGVWTVNERDAIARFINDGVGIVITDRPDLAKELLGR